MADVVPVPDWVHRSLPWTERRVFLPPSGDPTDEECRSADVLVDPSQPWGTAIRAYVSLDDAEIEALRSGGVVELVLHTGGGLCPFGVAVWQPPRDQRR